ncbi:MAG: hypothetical protein ABW174_09640 [Flavitalea sp.]
MRGWKNACFLQGKQITIGGDDNVKAAMQITTYHIDLLPSDLSAKKTTGVSFNATEPIAKEGKMPARVNIKFAIQVWRVLHIIVFRIR